jgi:hypothetical protein
MPVADGGARPGNTLGMKTLAELESLPIEDLVRVSGGSPTLPLPPPSVDEFQTIDVENKDGKTR